MNPLWGEQCYWNSAAVRSADSCVSWASCAPYRQLCPEIAVHLEITVPCRAEHPDRHVPGPAVCHTVPCEHWDSLQTAVCHVHSCVPYSQLCSLQTVLHTAGLQSSLLLTHHLTECQLLGRVSTSVLAEWTCLKSTHCARAQDINRISSIWGKQFKEQHQKQLWLWIGMMGTSDRHPR